MSKIYDKSRVQNRILEAVSALSWIKDKVDDFTDTPSVEAAQELESVLLRFSTESDALRNAIVVMTKEIAGVDVDGEGLKEIDVVPELDGLRLA